MSERVFFDIENCIVFLYSNNSNNWEDKTLSIGAIFKAYYYGNFTGYDIYFRGGSRKFFYKAENLRFLYKQSTVNIEKSDVYVNSKMVNAHKVDSFEDGYYRVYIGNSFILTKKIELKNNKYKEIFRYYIELSKYAEQISDRDEPLYFLSQNYKRIHPTHQSVLFNYLRGEFLQVDDREVILVPFDFNQSQYMAIGTALKTDISIIEGPPGTGKTQTILNLIVNIFYRGQNCAVVSNNNTPIDNIYEKLTEEGLQFIAATLGRQKNVINFFESNRNEDLNEFLTEKKEQVPNHFRNYLMDLSSQMKKIQNTEVKFSLLRTQLEEIKREKKNHDKILLDDVIINKNLTSKHYFKLIRRLEQPRKIRFFERWRINYKYKIKLTSTNIDDLLYNAENLFYVKSISEIQEQLNKYKTFLDNSNKESIELELKKISRDLLVNKIQNHYENVEITGFNKDSYKNDYNNFILRYPVVLSTSQSLLNNAPNGFLFDYLIIDEASQCDLLSSVLAMSCSKNIVVVGDSRQLQQIDEERLFFQSQKLAKDFDIPTQYTYEANSILRSVKEAVVAVPTTLLKEHYRCAPDIINFCNKMFYNNELVAMTNNTGKHIEIIKTVPGNHARKNPYGSGLYNQREIDEINNIIQKANSKNIGVITPFRYQANLIQNKYKDTNLEADTIHKFQGRQKDEIIMSFVVNSLDNDPNNVENKLYDFVTNDKLLNVAISRGKSKVTIIVSDKLYHTKNNIIKDFIEYSEYLYGSSVTKESTVKSIFDYLYSEYNKDFISKYNEKPKKYQSELLMCSLIDKVLIDHHFIGYSMHVRLGKLVNILDIFNEEEKKYILHPWTHVDFLFYNKVTKKSLFVIEVDGIRYHEQKKKQVVHDKIKDRVLAMNNIPVFRFKTNESNEKERLKEIIHQYTY